MAQINNKERTFLMIKPDAVHRGLIADIIKRFEQKGYKLVAMKFVKVWAINSETAVLYHFLDCFQYVNKVLLFY